MISALLLIRGRLSPLSPMAPEPEEKEGLIPRANLEWQHYCPERAVWFMSEADVIHDSNHEISATSYYRVGVTLLESISASSRGLGLPYFPMASLKG